MFSHMPLQIEASGEDFDTKMTMQFQLKMPSFNVTFDIYLCSACVSTGTTPTLGALLLYQRFQSGLN